MSRCSSSGSSASNAVSSPAVHQQQLDTAEDGDKQQQRAQMPHRPTAAAAAPAGEEQHEAPAAGKAGEIEAVVDDDSDSDAGSFVVCDDSDIDIMEQQQHAGAVVADPLAPAAARDPVAAGSHSFSASAGRVKAGQIRQRVVHSSQGAVVPYGRRLAGPHARSRARAVHHRELLLHHQQQHGPHAVQVVGQQTLVINHNKLVISEEVAALMVPVAR